LENVKPSTGQLVSIIMPVYNGERFLHEALESVFSQTYTHYQLIVVNDGSSDNSAKILSDYGDRIIYIEQSNQGIAGAYNSGIRKSTGEYISFIEQDDLWLPHKLEHEVNALNENKQLGMAYSLYYLGNESGAYDAQNICQSRMNGRCFNKLFSENLEGSKIIPFSAVTVRTEAIRSIGELDKRLRISIDYDTWLKISYKYNIRNIEEPALIYRQHSSNTSSDALRAQLDDAQIIEFWANNSSARAHLGGKLITKRLSDLYANIAWQYYRLGDHKKTRSYRLKISKLRPSDPRGWLLLAYAYLPQYAQHRLAWYKTKILSMLNLA
jgi:glycosyltransferase involved in cell wall biosynthesis